MGPGTGYPQTDIAARLAPAATAAGTSSCNTAPSAHTGGLPAPAAAAASRDGVGGGHGPAKRRRPAPAGVRSRMLHAVLTSRPCNNEGRGPGNR